MWSVIYIIFGFLLLFIAVADVFTTALAQGRGLVSDKLNILVWKLMLIRHKSAKNRKQHMLQGGILALLTSIAGWIMLLWVGWWLVFCGSENAIVSSQSMIPASFLERFYFAGYTTFTLGLGDFKPTSGFYMVCTTLASLSGLLFITFSITYIIPVLQAGLERRSLALYISGLGSSVQKMLGFLYEENISVFEQHCVSLAQQLSLLAQQHSTYSVLRFYLSADRKEAAGPNIASLYETLLIVRHSSTLNVSRAAIDPVLRSIQMLLNAIRYTGFKPAKHQPRGVTDIPVMQQVFSEGDQKNYQEFLQEDRENRLMLLGFVHSDGWQWDDVYESQS